MYPLQLIRLTTDLLIGFIAMPKLRIFLVLLVLGLIGILFLFIYPVGDDSVQRQFEKHRNELERLAYLVSADPNVFFFRRNERTNSILFVADKKIREIPTSTIHSSSAEILRLFESVNCESVARGDGEIEIRFPGKCFEHFYPGGYKLIALSSNRPAIIVPSIDSYRRRNPGKYGFYKHLDGDWYIKYMRAH